MNTGQKAGLAATVALAAVGVTIAATGGDDAKAPASCTFAADDAGSFTVPDDAKRCDIVFGRPGLRTCRMWPTVDSSIGYQWSYEVTPTGAIVRGLKKGAAITFECKEPR